MLVISSHDITLIFHTETIPIHTHLHFILYAESTAHTLVLKHNGYLSTRSRPMSTEHSLSRKNSRKYMTVIFHVILQI